MGDVGIFILCVIVIGVFRSLSNTCLLVQQEYLHEINTA